MRRLLNAPETEFGLRLLVLEQLKGADVAGELKDELRALMMDGQLAFALRSAAADVLVGLETDETWPQVVYILLTKNDEDSLRLALEVIDARDYAFEPSLIASVIVAYVQIDDHTAGVFYNFERRTPNALLDRWNLELLKVLNAPDVREQLNKHGLTPQPGTRDELARYMASETATWGRIIKQRKISAE